MKHPLNSAARSARGIALITVLVIMSLGTVAIIGAFRMAALAESVTGNNADYTRTFAAAEATLHDAENDVRGRLPKVNNPANIWAPDASDGGLGLPCRSGLPPLGRSFIGCRTVDAIAGSSNDFLWIPRNSADYAALYLIAMNTAGTTRCRQGICIPENMVALAGLHTRAVLQQVFEQGTFYGRYTGAVAGNASSNPSLSQNTAAVSPPPDGQPWSRYWIEVFRYGQSVNNGATAAADLVPDPNAPFVYRLTAIAQGRKPGSRVVLREVFVPNPISQNP
jgi:type IV pilus assembly protein PilX